MTKKRQILVIGNNTNGCTPKHEKIAYDVGSEIAKSDSVLITGGLGGVMAAASHGAHDANGLTVGIIPQDDATMANEFCDIVIPTGMGLTRDFLNALTADGVIIVGGGSGTLSEVCAAYMYKKPMVAIRNIGGSVEPYIDGFIDHRENIKIIGVDTPQEAVKKILELITAPYNRDSETTDAEIIDAFNKIKSGEASRMAQKSSG
ncbi:MAG: TIGR00725 family protein [Thaumarchaeota archaeon]|nr:TIGR00725 family protein [Nitrososphaerota archaeon]